MSWAEGRRIRTRHLIAAAVFAAAVFTCAGALAERSAAAATPPSIRAATPAVWDTLAAMESTGRWRAADSVATALVQSLDGPVVQDSAALARALVRQASYHRILGRLRDGSALSAGSRAVAIAERLFRPDTREFARTHSALSMVFVDLEMGDSALAHAQRGLAIAMGAIPRDDSLVAMQSLRVGLAQRSRGDYAGAVAPITTARDRMQSALGDTASALATIQAELGSVLTVLGEFDRARAELEASVRIAELHFETQPQPLEAALSRLMIFERKLGHMGNAVDLGERVYALALARTGGDGPHPQAYRVNLAYALHTLGDDERARSLMTNAVAYHLSHLPPASTNLLQLRIALADACRKLWDLAAAEAQLDAVDSVLSATPHPPAWLVTYNLTVRSLVDLRAGRRLEARRRLLAASPSGPVEPAQHLDVLGLLFDTLRGTQDRALADSLSRSLDAFADSTAIEQAKNWPTFQISRARAEARVGERERARRHALQSEAAALGQFGWELAALSDRQALLWDETTHDAADVLIETALPEQPNEIREAWDMVVRRRGLVREVVEGRRELPATADTALANAHARWVAEQRRHAQIVVSGTLSGTDSTSRQRFELSRDAVESAERRYARLSALAGRPMDAPTIEKVLARLGGDEAIVAFVRTEVTVDMPQLSALYASGRDRTPRLIRLGPDAPIAAAVNEWLEALSSPPSTDLRAARASEALARSRGERVRRMVWDPLRAVLGGAKAVQIVPAGPVLDLPWLALPTSRGRYLAEEDVNVIVRPAERELLGAAMLPENRGLLAVGDPDFDSGSMTTTRSGLRALQALPGACTPATVRLGRLPGALAEVEDIAKEWMAGHQGGSAQLLTQGGATEARFKELARGRQVLHLATHGVLTRSSCASAPVLTRGVGGVAPLAGGSSRAVTRRPEKRATTLAPSLEPEPSPWLGREVWLALAGANQLPATGRDENEGWLTADEVVTLDLRGTQRVVLSACQSGVAERWTRDGLLGMRRAFHLAGAQAVVASQWGIADTATREWMAAFYASASPSTSVALQDASRALLESRRRLGRTTHPFYWGAFTATGD